MTPTRIRPAPSARAVPEWIGSHPDQKVPERVRIRIFEAHKGICHIAKRKIMGGEPWELDHVVALINGGEHRESNLAPALKDKHRIKTKADVAEKSRVARKRQKHLGITKRGRGFRTWRNFRGDIIRREDRA